MRIASRALPRLVTTILALLLLQGRALAQGAADKAGAESLFDEGRALLAAGQYREACPKFAESQRLDPGIGTLLNLGDCYEKDGKTASAWAQFREAAAMARVAGDTKREAVAQKRASSLEARLSKLTVTVPATTDVPGLEVVRDGVPMGRAAWGTAAPLDPGRHVLEARAPGRKRWSTQVFADAQGSAISVTIPPLAADAPPPISAPPVAAAAPPQPSVVAARPPRRRVVETPRGTAQRAVGITLGAAGLVSAGVGGIFGLRAASKNDDSKRYCIDAGCEPDGMTLRHEAIDAARISTICFAAGGAAFAGGVILLLTAPSGTETTVVGVGAAPAGGRLQLTRSW